FAAAQASPVAPERFSAPAFSEKTARAGAAEKGEDGGRKRRRTTKRRTRRTRRRSAPARSSEDAPRSIRAIALVHRGEAIALAVRALLAVAPGAAARRVLLRVRARRGLRLVQDDGPLGTIIPYSEQVSE
ncbi:unnamed protein product, partial [Prorocentrum cordatum]